MDEFMIERFKDQVALNLRILLLAHADMRTAWKDASAPDPLWYAAQAVLTATANVSKALWGEKGKYTKQRTDLRTRLQVDDSSPIRATTMRNHFDHFDERLDEWARKAPPRNFIDQGIGDLDSVFPGWNHREIMRHYDPFADRLTFWGDVFELQEIVEEAQRILDVIMWLDTEPHPPPRKRMEG